MQDLIRSQNASTVNIVPDMSVSTLPQDRFACDGNSILGYYQDIRGDDSGLDSSIHHMSFQSSSRRCESSYDSLDYFSEMESRDGFGDEVSLDNVQPSRRKSKGRSLIGVHDINGFRERHRRLKQSLSPVKVYKLSPKDAGSQTTPTTSRNRRSRLDKITSASDIGAPPSFNDL